MKKQKINKVLARSLAASCPHLQNIQCPVCWLDGDKEPSLCCAFCIQANKCVHMEIDLWADEGCLLSKAVASLPQRKGGENGN